VQCKICSSEASYFGRFIVLRKHPVDYFCCPRCGFVQTEDPFWLKEAYTESINTTDVGMISRNLVCAKMSKAIISSFFNTHGKFLDFGGGYGVFVRMMRDLGFDFYWHDKHCVNLFAKDYEAANILKDNYDLLTAFEVLEHLQNPMSEIEEMSRLSDHILFSTQLVPTDNPKPDQWWYYGREHGQHISFYSLRSLHLIAERLKTNCYSNGSTFHMFSKKHISPSLFKLVMKGKVASILNFLKPGRSLLQDDYERAVQKAGAE
jgi:hypothetical protein